MRVVCTVQGGVLRYIHPWAFGSSNACVVKTVSEEAISLSCAQRKTTQIAMAYYMQSLIPSKNPSGKHYDTFMVAEHAFYDPRTEESKMKFIGDIMPVEFDTEEAERRIIAMQDQVKAEVMTSMDALNVKLTADMLAMNAKFDAIKTARDHNDNYIKLTVDTQIKSIWDMLTVTADGITRMNDSFTQMNVKIAATDAAIAAVAINPQAVNPPPGFGFGGAPIGPVIVKSIMENKAVQNIEKLTVAPGDWMIWQLRLKNALTQVDEIYEYILGATESTTRPIPSFENWNTTIAPTIHASCGKTEAEMNKYKRDLYTVLVDKCTGTQVLAFENDEKDGIYAYYSLYRNFRLTAGLGQIEKREFLTRPPTAKNESEVYDCIITWEREVKEQEKLVKAEQRPILSKTIKGAVLKNIAFGNIREYIKTHEAIKDCLLYTSPSPRDTQ